MSDSTMLSQQAQRRQQAEDILIQAYLVANRDFDCRDCEDQGFTVADVPPGHPQYQRRIPCPHCERGHAYALHLQRVYFKRAQLPAKYQTCTFDSFQQFDPALQQGKLLAFGAAWLFAQGQPFTLQQAASVVGVTLTFPDDRPRQWLVFNGLNGYGKTGLAAAVTNELMQRNKFPVFSRLQDLISDIQSTYHPESKTTRDAKMQHYQAAPYLILDECNLAITDDRLSIVEELVRYRYAHSLPTLFTTNWGQAEFEKQWGLQIGDVVATAHWITLSGQKLRDTSGGEVVSF